VASPFWSHLTAESVKNGGNAFTDALKARAFSGTFFKQRWLAVPPFFLQRWLAGSPQFE
jgi:hypothetical protein